MFWIICKINEKKKKRELKLPRKRAYRNVNVIMHPLGFRISEREKGANGPCGCFCDTLELTFSFHYFYKIIFTRYSRTGGFSFREVQKQSDFSIGLLSAHLNFFLILYNCLWVIYYIVCHEKYRIFRTGISQDIGLRESRIGTFP